MGDLARRNRRLRAAPTRDPTRRRRRVPVLHPGPDRDGRGVAVLPAKQGRLPFEPANGTSIAVFLLFVPKLLQGGVNHLHSEGILAIDSFGLRGWQEPS